MSTQFTLPIDDAYCPTMDNFVVGENLELVTFLRSPKAEFRGIWISGPRSSGRTHLLQAYCRAALQSGRQGIYLDCADLAVGASAQIQRAVNLASASDALVVLDNLGELQRDPRHEEALMLIYQSLYAVEGEMLVCHDQSARGVEFDLPDLNSRMRGFAHFALVPLRDQDKAEVLTQRAHTKGYDLPDAVLEYWLRRGPRDLSTLVRDLERLDQATLTHQRLLTVPLLKQVLGY